MIGHLAGVVVANLLLLVLGAGMLSLLGAWRRLTRWSRPAVALLGGQATFVVAAPLLLYARLSVHPLVVCPLIAVVTAAGAVVERRRSGDLLRRPDGGRVLGLVLTGPPLLFLALRSSLHPLFQFDTISNWVTKAAVLWAGGDRLTGVLDPGFFARADLHPQSHLEYPLGMNSLFAWDIHWMGAVDGRALHLQFVLLLAGLVGTAWTLLRPLVPPAPLATGLAGLVLMPAIYDRVLSAYADLPLACVWAAGTIALLRWAEEDEPYLLRLATLLLAGTLALKQDAVFYDVAALVAVAAALAVRRRRGALLHLAGSAAIVALTALPWRAYVALHDLSDEDFAPGLTRMRAQTGNLRPTLEALGHTLDARTTFVAVPLAAVLALACLVRRRRADAAPFLLTTFLVPLAILLGYWNAAANLRFALLPAVTRVLTGTVVLAWLLVPVFAYALLEREPGDL